jgi:hypothetical protein
MQMNAPDGVYYKVLFLGLSPFYPSRSTSTDRQDVTVKDGTITLPINTAPK